MFERRYRTTKWCLFALLLYGLLMCIAALLFSSEVFAFLNPLHLTQFLFGWWINIDIPLILLFAGIPLLCWFCINKNLKLGKYILITLHTVLISLNLVISLLHLINALYMFRGESLVESLLCFLLSTAYSILVITLTMLWFPKRDF